jgi:predicted transposase YdaD
MHKPWDNFTKRIFGARPQDFVSWLLPGAVFLDKTSVELKTLTRTVTSDMLYKVQYNGRIIILHIEFQRRPEAGMEKRIWEYNVLATLEHNCPVYSFVIYLSPGGKIADPPLVWQHPGEEIIHYFRYWQIKLWETPIEDLRATGLPGLLPLCVLAKDGKQREVAKQTFQDLWQQQEKVLLALALSFASLVLTKDDEAAWLEGEAEMYEDFLSDTWYYQHILSKGEKKGEEKGIEKGIETGMRTILLDIVQMRFPVLIPLAQEQLAHIQDPVVLRRLNAEIIQAQSVEEAERHLREIFKNAS